MTDDNRSLFLYARHERLIQQIRESFHDYQRVYVTGRFENGVEESNTASYHTVIICPHLFIEKPFLQTESTDWNNILTENFEIPVFLAQDLAKQMIKHQIQGRIIFLSSVAGLKTYENLSALGSSMAALHSVAKMAAVDLAPYGITVNVVALGWFDGFWQTTSISEDMIRDHIPTGEYGTLAKIADLCRFLASDSASYLTGAIIPLDGGYSITKAGAGTPVQPGV